MKHVIAMDLGGTKILAAVVNEKGKIVKQIKAQTQLAGGWHVLKNQIVSIVKYDQDAMFIRFKKNEIRQLTKLGFA